jgi:hypothetical protein
MRLPGISALLLLLIACPLYGQDKSIGLKDACGFIRGGLYTGFDKAGKNSPYVSGLYSDIGIKLSTGNGVNFKAYTDASFRYGNEFKEQAGYLQMKEAYIRLYGTNWDITAGQQIIKWGRADFTNPTSKLNPQDYLARSPRREDMDLGNICATVAWSPSEFLNLSAVLLPAYRPSVLIIGPIKLPAYVSLDQNNSLVTGEKMLSYAVRSDFTLSRVDFGLSWFNGYDPMPGISLDKYHLDLSTSLPDFSLELSEKPYRINMVGVDFEFIPGQTGLRGEAALTLPYLSSEDHEYVPFPELKWVLGLDRTAGNWSLLVEYSGKRVIDFREVLVKPLIGNEPDLSDFIVLFQDPGFDPGIYLKDQVAAFNRLMNYQLGRSNHAAGARIGAELASGRVLPSAYTMYNFTTRDLLVIPEIKIKPADGMAITLGAELYHGRKGSLYDIADDFMNCIFLGVRVDF